LVGGVEIGQAAELVVRAPACEDGEDWRSTTFRWNVEDGDVPGAAGIVFLYLDHI
jgi:hypothetical protein